MTKEELLIKMNDELVNLEINHELYGRGFINKLTGNSNILLVVIAFQDSLKIFSARIVASKMTKNEVVESLLRYCDEYEKLIKEEKVNLFLKRQAEEQRAEQLLKEKKEQELYNQYVEKVFDKIKCMERKSNTYNIIEDEEDWINKNLSIRAYVPDFLENWFKSVFTDANYRLIDSHRTTSGGYKMKWNLSLVATVKDVENAPAFIAKYIHDNKITDTEFLFALCTKYNLTIGKKK